MNIIFPLSVVHGIMGEGLFYAGMLIRVLVLKDSLRTFFKSLSLSSSLGSGPCPCPGPCGSGPCPYPGPCGLVLFLVLVFSPCKDLFPLFHYSDLNVTGAFTK